jgi:hypothetical protein
MIVAISTSINGMLNFYSGMIYKILEFIFICWMISDSTVQRVTAISAVIYTPVGIGLNILLLALIIFFKHDAIKDYKV